MEVPACETEDDRDLILVMDDSVDDETVLFVENRNHQRQDSMLLACPTDEVGGFVTDKDGSEELQCLDIFLPPGRSESAADAGGRGAGGVLQVTKGGAKPGVLQDFGDDLGGDVSCGVYSRRGELPAEEGEREVTRQIVDLRLDSDVREDPAGQRVEEGLSELEVLGAEDGVAVDALGSGPEVALFDFRSEFFAERLEGFVDATSVNLKAADGVATNSVPVALLEAFQSASRDGAKALVELLEAPIDDVGCAMVRKVRAYVAILAAVGVQLALGIAARAVIDKAECCIRIYRTVGRFPFDDDNGRNEKD